MLTTSFRTQSRGRIRGFVTRLFTGAALFAVLASCDAEATGPRDTFAIGVYTLIRVNEQALPYTLEDRGNYIRQLTAGVISLNADGTFSDRISQREITAGVSIPSTDTIIGSYSRVQNTITFTSAADQTRWRADWNGVDLVETTGDLSLRYTR